MDGHYAYQELRPPEVLLAELKTSRRIIESFPEYAGMEMHLTEFNTSYSPQCPVHDTNLNAAYIARLLSELGDTCASYSYWTFGDVFEETGPAFTPFSGGFGLLANGMIPKPTYWTFRFFRELDGEALFRDGNCVVTREDDGTVHGVAWNLAEETLALKLALSLEDGQYLLVTRTVDEQNGNPLKNWLDMGSPPSPKQEQLELLRECARPKTETARLEVQNGEAKLNLLLKANAVCAFILERVKPYKDRGYDPERVHGTGRENMR
jgi:xylan 1,4-beta-xylosidase